MPLRSDLIIRDATLFDGTGAPRTTDDVGVSGDCIMAVGSLGGLPPVEWRGEIKASRG